MENSDPLVFAYNKKAMDYLRNGNNKKALIYLAKAEEVLSTGKVENFNKLMGITLNNFGCFYKRTGNPLLALNFLKKALEIEKKPPVDLNYLAGTHLNMCAILSNIGEHHQALDHSCEAIKLLKEKAKEEKTLLATLVVAYHNTGIEFEVIGQLADAKKSYIKGLKLIVDNFSETHPLAVSLKNSLKGINKARKTTSVSPIKSSPFGMPAIHRGSVSIPRNSEQSMTKNTEQLITKNSDQSAKTKKQESARLATGERLEPVHKTEDFRTREVKSRKRNDLRKIIKDIDRDASRFIQEKNKEEESKKKTDASDRNEFGERVSIATQVDICDNTLHRSIKNKAAVIIQKHCRRFLAKRVYQNLLFEKNLKIAEKEMIRAKEKFDKLRSAKKKKNAKDLFPIAFKSKIEGKIKEGIHVAIKVRNKNDLPTILEENEERVNKAIIIQKHFRGWRVKKSYQRSKNAVLVIQKNAKSHITRSLYRSILDAVIFIQRFWKKYYLKQKITKLL